MGREMVTSMEMLTDYEPIMQKLQEVNEMLALISSSDNDLLPSDEFNDPREMFNRIRIIGLHLEEDELADLHTILSLIRQTVSFFNRNQVDSVGEDNYPYPTLRLLTDDIQTFPLLIQTIDKVVDKYGRIKDSASPELAQTRRDIRDKESQITRRLNQILKQAQTDGIVEADASVSIRDGRAVIPVAAANKRRLQGIVMDESASGRTSYIEPAEIVSMNNDLRELQYAERREIIRILTSLTDNIRPYSEDILDGVDMLAKIDFIRGKAIYARDIDAVMPEVDKKAGTYIYGGRHPLLHVQLKAQGKSVVPLDIELKWPNARIAIISGPNAGGKSVCLQTVGILHYMLQCGLLVPVKEGSKMGIFKDILIDMGDEQSIENDLSTYSSHLTNMKMFVKVCSKSSLILIDEFGTGTEPAIGGAIAESVLDELNKMKAWGVITTHYTNLKHFAAQTDGLVNAAMLFDTHKIEPLFKLRMGQPGSSFAFEIARKIGLPESILESAKEKIGQEHLDFDKHLREIIRDKNYYEQRREQIRQREKRVEELESQYDQGLQNIKRERREILDKAKAEAQQLLSETNRRIENTIREIKESQAEKQKTKEAREALNAFEQTVEESDADKEREASINRKIEKIKRQQEQREKRRAQQGNTPEVSAEKKTPELAIEVGAMVQIDGKADRIGEILKINKNEALVAMGGMQSNIKLSRLKAISKSAAKKSAGSASANMALARTYSNVMEAVREKKLNFKPDIDVRGMRTDEAIEQVAGFIDEAIICEQSQVRILHGKGNGILRQQLRIFLRSIDGVQHIADEDIRLGGAGITVVTLNS